MLLTKTLPPLPSELSSNKPCNDFAAFFTEKIQKTSQPVGVSISRDIVIT